LNTLSGQGHVWTSASASDISDILFDSGRLQEIGQEIGDIGAENYVALAK
jgi:hypothetical protein